MKLYIPTSSLNIDNILSTESIAPLSFYKARNYGYTSFHGIDLIPYKNVLILFSKIPNFEIQDKEHDCRSVVLEIDVNEQINPLKVITEKDDIKVFSTDSIIRINPFNTKVLFFSPLDLNNSRLNCSDSLTNKFGDRFRFDLCKAEFELLWFKSLNIHIDDICLDYEKKTLQDNRLNKIKGFIFGYYLGVSKSVSANSAILLKIQKRIYDIAATVRNNGGYGSTFYEELELLDKKFRANDPYRIKSKELWNKTLEEFGIPSNAINKLLETYDENNVVKNTFIKKNGLIPSITFNRYGFHNIEAYRDDIKSYTTRIIAEDRQSQLATFNVAATFDLDPSYETCMLSSDNEESTLFNKFIDAILWHDISPTPDTLRTDRFNIATQITISAKNIWGTMNWLWPDSSAQAFMNELRQNIKSFSPIDVENQDNIILKSIAAFILKGEDYDSIVQFCEDNSFADYRYSLALWGATLGYVKMSRPIISHLVDTTSFAQTYKSILYLLHNIEYQGELPHVQVPITILEGPVSKTPYVDSKLRSEVQSVLDTLTPSQRKANEPRVEKALELEGAQGSFEAYLYILNNLIRPNTKIFKEIKRVLQLPESQNEELSAVVKNVLRSFTKKNDAEYRKKVLLALELESKICDSVSFCYMLDDLNVPKGVRDKFFKKFNIKQEEKNVFKKVGDFFEDLFSNNQENRINNAPKPHIRIKGLSFNTHYVKDIADLIKALNPGISEFAYKQIINDLNWVFDPRYSSGKTELQLLETFRDNLISGQRESISRNGKDMKWKNDAYKPINIEKTINEIRKALNDK